MASTSTYPSLSVPAPDDTMEMSSPGHYNHDGDIEIEYGDQYDAIQYTDDEKMLEDENTRPGTATDEMMQDDDLGIIAPSNEAVMQDDALVGVTIAQDEDDELIDYDDEDFMVDQPVTADESSQNHDSLAQVSPDHPGQPSNDADGQQLQLSEDEKAQGSHEASVEDLAPKEQAKDQDGEDAAASAGQEVETVEVPKAGSSPHEQKAAPLETTSPVATSAAEEPEVTHAAELETTTRAPQPLDTSVETRDDGPPTPTDTGLHPMTIQWRDQVVPLFKAKLQPDGLLEDDNLVNVSLADFLSACKDRLNTVLAAKFSADDEIVVKFESLRLTLVEDSRSSFSTSLNDVLDVYITLHQNEGTQNIPPLSLIFTVQPRFSNLVEFLKENAAEGSGMSIIDALDNHAEDETNYYLQDASGTAAADGDGVEDDVPYEEVDENGEAAENYEDGAWLQETDDAAYPAADEDEFDEEWQPDLNEEGYPDDEDNWTQDPTEVLVEADNAGLAAGDSKEDPQDSEEPLEPVEFVDPQDDEEQLAEEEELGYGADQSQSAVVQTDSVLSSKDVRTDTADKPVDAGTSPSLQNDRQTTDQGKTDLASGQVAVPKTVDAGANGQSNRPDTKDFVDGDLYNFDEDDLEGEEGQYAEPVNDTADKEVHVDEAASQAEQNGDETHSLQPGEYDEDEQFHTALDLLDEETNHTTHGTGSKDDLSNVPVYDAEDVIDFDSDIEDEPAVATTAAAAVAPPAKQVSAGSKRSLSALDTDAADGAATLEVKKPRAA